jgi:two-component system, OmpR family, lantibiotic biosynthesis sensor histidine kinase NisK/SpaK
LRDAGCGIAPADLPHVFEKFYHGQVRPGEKARKTTGLGLYTCKLLVERHGGTIAIQNHPAGGGEVAFCHSLQLTALLLMSLRPAYLVFEHRRSL